MITTHHDHKLSYTPWSPHTMITSLATPHDHHTPWSQAWLHPMIATHHDHKLSYTPWLLHTMTTNLATRPSSLHITTTSYSSPWQRMCRCCSRWLQLHHHHTPRPQSYSSPWQRLCRCCSRWLQLHHQRTPQPQTTHLGRGCAYVVQGGYNSIIKHTPQPQTTHLGRGCADVVQGGYNSIITTYHDHKATPHLGKGCADVVQGGYNSIISIHHNHNLLTLAEDVPMLFRPCMDLAAGILVTGTPGVVAFLAGLDLRPKLATSVSERAGVMGPGVV